MSTAFVASHSEYLFGMISLQISVALSKIKKSEAVLNSASSLKFSKKHHKKLGFSEVLFFLNWKIWFRISNYA